MPDSVSVCAYAKLNLSLDITGTRPDGYHTLEMVMQSVDLCDHITVQKISEGIKLSCSSELPEDENNLAYKAAEAFIAYTGIDQGVKIKIKKNIPVAAGLGGGSADAAAVLNAMNCLFNSELCAEQLCEIGSHLGSDVPFCINGGTQLSEGTGIILTPLPQLSDCCFVIIKNGEKRSTADMYRMFDAVGDVVHPQTRTLIDCICEGETLEAAKYMENAFEQLWGDDIAAVKHALIDGGAAAAALSGSGPSMFGLFRDEEAAKHCKNMLSGTYDEIYICRPVDTGFAIR